MMRLAWLFAFPMSLTLTAIAITQNTQRQPSFSARNPPQTGPMTGPMIGPRAQMAMIPARFSLGTMSATVPDPMVSGQTPAMPASRRNTISWGSVCATAQAMVKIRKSTLHAWYSGTRPYSSDNGAMINGPTMYPKTKTDTTNEASIWSVE